MKIAQVSPLYESVPPKLYGGTERVVSYLSDALVDAGHKVTLFASGDSVTKADLVPICDKALRLDPDCVDHLAYHFIQLQEVMDRAKEFDFIHFHIDYLHYPFSQFLNIPYATTLHGRLNMRETSLIYKRFSKQPVISISNFQRKPVPHANWVGNVYHGLPKNLLKKGDGNGGYVAFLGRISPEKRVDRAISIAISAGRKIKIAAKVDKADQAYFDHEIKNLLDHPLVEFIGEINEYEKNEFLGNAECLLFPIDWPEPFGLVMIEAMACGTPVIAYENGSVPEVLENGKTGFIVGSKKEAIASLAKLKQLDRNVIRREFERRFSSDKMAQNYVSIFETLSEQVTSEKKYLRNPKKEEEGYQITA